MGSLAAIENATIEDLTAIDGVGPEIAESVVNWFAATREPGDWRGATLRAWQAAGVGVDEAETSSLPQTLAGKTVVAIRVIPPKRRLSSAAARRPVR